MMDETHDETHEATQGKKPRNNTPLIWQEKQKSESQPTKAEVTAKAELTAEEKEALLVFFLRYPVLFAALFNAMFLFKVNWFIGIGGILLAWVVWSIKDSSAGAGLRFFVCWVLALVVHNNLFPTQHQDTPYQDTKRACVERGVAYFKSIGSYPFLTSSAFAGKSAENEATERCNRSTQAF